MATTAQTTKLRNALAMLPSVPSDKGWDADNMGFYRLGHTEKMTSERAVFEFVGVPFNPPEKR
jgi:hypothetical protein